MSVADLQARAARFSLLAEQASHLSWWSRQLFWETSVSPVRDPTACLPAMAAAVRKEDNADVLRALAHHPLPGVLPSKAVPWFDNLVEAWETHRASSDVQRQNLARRALVRLDGCSPPDGQERPSRLAEWLEETRKIANSKWKTEKLEALATLTAWHPAPRVTTPPETLREWVAFWQEIRQNKNTTPVLKGIAARALLNLPEADLRAASIQLYGRVLNPPQLLRDLAAAIPAAAKRIAQARYDIGLLLPDWLLDWLDWQPGENSSLPAADVAEVARAWLEVASYNHWWCRPMALQQLIRWEQAGNLASCGIDLLPFLAREAQTEQNELVLWQMARWTPVAEAFTGTEKPDRPALLREWEAHWQQHRQSRNWPGRASAWLAGIRLHQAGLAAEPPESFRESYLSAVAGEGDADVLFVLAQWSPDAEAPAAFHWDWRQGWQQKLADKNGVIQQVAAFALLRQVVTAGEMAEQLAPDGKEWDMAGRRRWLREFLRSYGPTAGGDEGNDRTVEFMNSILNSLWTKLNGGLFSEETTGGRSRAEALILGGPGAVFVHPQRDMVSPVGVAGSFTESQAAPGAVPGRSPSLAG